MVKKKIIFVMPPKDWFYGIDYVSSERIVKYFRDNHLFDVYKFENIDIFSKNRLGFKNLFKLIYFYIFFKIINPKYVFALNAGYITYCSFIFKKKIINFFSQTLKIKCILRWDHLNEQIPNIVENIFKKSQFNQVYDYKKFFLEEINNKNFTHYSWQKDQYFCEKDYLETALEVDKLELKELNYFFTYDVEKKTQLKVNNGYKEIALIGYINKLSKPKTNINDISFLLKDKKNFFNKKYYQKLIDHTNYEYSKNKIDLLKIDNIKFHGIDLIQNTGDVMNANDFYSEISKFFLIINPTHPLSLTLTLKFYLIFLYGGFCINELPKNIPPKLDKFKEYIFYKDQKDLINKIDYLKSNSSDYFSIKKEISEISNKLKDKSYKNFIDEFKVLQF